MALNFPSNPTANQVYTLGEKSWKWNGYGWKMQDPTSAANLELSVFNTVADGSASTFDLGFVPFVGNLLLVSIGGVVQPEGTYVVNVSNSTISFTSPPPASENVRAVGYSSAIPYYIDAANSAGASIETFSTVGDNTTTTFNIGFNPVGASAIFVTVGGIVQPESAYTVNPITSTITFDTAPGTGENIRVVGFSKVNPYYIQYISSNVSVSVFETTANGATATFNLGFLPQAKETLIVTIDGIVQPITAYSVDNNSQTITLDEAPASGELVRVATLYTTANAFITPDGSITTAKFASDVTANISGAYNHANSAFNQANTAASTGKAIAMSIVFGG